MVGKSDIRAPAPLENVSCNNISQIGLKHLNTRTGIKLLNPRKATLYEITVICRFQISSPLRRNSWSPSTSRHIRRFNVMKRTILAE